MFYPVVIHQEKESAFGVIVPNLPGCFSAGDTLDEALENVTEAIDLHLEGLAEDGDRIPAAGSLAELKDNPDYADGVWVLVPVDLTRYLGKAQRINISLPNLLLTKIDRFVETHKEYGDRSKFLADASIKLMQHA
jgi:predicted RNase H-like HicB family nuclease